MRVDLDDGEMFVAQCLASARRCLNQSAGIIDQRRDKAMQASQLDTIGMVAEIAWAKAMGTYPDLTIRPRAGSVDAVLDGKRIDIKATTRTNGQLLATPTKSHDDHRADYYVLAVVDETKVEFVGYASAEELLSDETLTNLGHGPTHAVPQSRLRRFRCDREGLEEHAV